MYLLILTSFKLLLELSVLRKVWTEFMICILYYKGIGELLVCENLQRRIPSQLAKIILQSWIVLSVFRCSLFLIQNWIGWSLFFYKSHQKLLHQNLKRVNPHTISSLGAAISHYSRQIMLRAKYPYSCRPDTEIDIEAVMEDVWIYG